MFNFSKIICISIVIFSYSQAFFKPNNNLKNECKDLAKHLNSCTPYLCKTSINSNLSVEIEILGLQNNKCIYEQRTITNKALIPGKLRCEYSEQTRKNVAQQFIATMNAKSYHFKANMLSSAPDSTKLVVDGKQIPDALNNAIRSGECFMADFHNQRLGDTPISKSQNKAKSNSSLNITWGKFQKTKATFGDAWQMDITIQNNQKKDIIFDIKGISKTSDWIFIKDKRVKSQTQTTIKLTIDHLKFNKLAFDKKKIIIKAYECQKFDTQTYQKVCHPKYGDELNPFSLIKAKNIKPTSTYTKYYNFNSIEKGPSEINQQEYKK